MFATSHRLWTLRAGAKFWSIPTVVGDREGVSRRRSKRSRLAKVRQTVHALMSFECCLQRGGEKKVGTQRGNPMRQPTEHMQQSADQCSCMVSNMSNS